MARLRNAPSAQNAPAAKATRQALKDRTNTATTKGPVYENDGNTDGLIKDSRRTRRRVGKAAQTEDEYVMTGGLGLRDEDEIEVAHSEPVTTTDELAKSDGPTIATQKSIRRPARAAKVTTQTKTQSKDSNGAKKSTQAPAKTQVSKKSNRDLTDEKIVVTSSGFAPAQPPAKRQSNQSRTERSDFSLSPTPPPPGKLHSVKRSSLNIPGSAMRGQGTPAVESSILALKNFKRRPRQPSMLQMVQQRTASARPSGINTNTNTTQDASVFDLEAGLEDEEFAPEAEGTPIAKKVANKSKQANAKKAVRKKVDDSAGVAPPSAQSRKRKSDQAEDSLSSLDALKTKRQKAAQPDGEDQIAHFEEIIPPQRSSSERPHSAEPQLTSDVQVINSSPSSTPPSDPPSSRLRSRYASVDPDEVVPSTEKEQDYVTQQMPLNDAGDDVQEDIPNGTMAEPLSSSPLRISHPPRQATQETDIMADPLTQVSPKRTKTREKKAKEKPSKPLNTAALQALLPKRRQPLKPRQRKSEYDIDSDSEGDDEPLDNSHLDSDEDELSGTIRRRTKSATASKSRKSTAAKSRHSKAATSRKSTAPSSRKASRKSKPSKTYGKGTTSDKENEDAEFEDVENDDSILPDTSMSMYEATTSKELQEIKKKFEDLDGWEMEFESVEVEEGRSSSQLWR